MYVIWSFMHYLLKWKQRKCVSCGIFDVILTSYLLAVMVQIEAHGLNFAVSTQDNLIFNVTNCSFCEWTASGLWLWRVLMWFPTVTFWALLFPVCLFYICPQCHPGLAQTITTVIISITSSPQSFLSSHLFYAFISVNKILNFFVFYFTFLTNYVLALPI